VVRPTDKLVFEGDRVRYKDHTLYINPWFDDPEFPLRPRDGDFIFYLITRQQQETLEELAERRKPYSCHPFMPYLVGLVAAKGPEGQVWASKNLHDFLLEQLKDTSTLDPRRKKEYREFAASLKGRIKKIEHGVLLQTDDLEVATFSQPEKEKSYSYRFFGFQFIAAGLRNVWLPLECLDVMGPVTLEGPVDRLVVSGDPDTTIVEHLDTLRAIAPRILDIRPVYQERRRYDPPDAIERKKVQEQLSAEFKLASME